MNNATPAISGYPAPRVDSEGRLDLRPRWLSGVWPPQQALDKILEVLPRPCPGPKLHPEDRWEMQHHWIMHEKASSMLVPEKSQGRIKEIFT